MVKQLIKEAMDKNPIGLKEALQEELRNRIALALEAKMDHSDEDDYEDEEDDLDEETFTLEELEDFMESAEFDQLDEISKQKMGQYIKRAHADKDTQVKRADIFDQKGMDANKEADMYSAWAKANKARKKAGNRTAFIGKAVDRLAKD
jgi:hypothetical protein